MTVEELISEGRKLQRPCTFLRPQKSGPVAAVWHERDDKEIERTGHHCWLTVDVRHIPGPPTAIAGCISVFTDEESYEGRVEVLPSWPTRPGTSLYAHPASVLPPVDAVFARGSEAVGKWLRSLGWDRHIPYNGNFRGAAIVEEYERAWQQEFPLYLDSDIHAVLGGWHCPMPDDDWHDLIDDQLMVFTLQDSEPWVEAWRTADGQYKVIQRLT